MATVSAFRVKVVPPAKRLDGTFPPAVAYLALWWQSQAQLMGGVIADPSGRVLVPLAGTARPRSGGADFAVVSSDGQTRLEGYVRPSQVSGVAPTLFGARLGRRAPIFAGALESELPLSELSDPIAAARQILAGLIPGPEGSDLPEAGGGELPDGLCDEALPVDGDEMQPEAVGGWPEWVRTGAKVVGGGAAVLSAAYAASELLERVR